MRSVISFFLGVVTCAILLPLGERVLKQSFDERVHAKSITLQCSAFGKVTRRELVGPVPKICRESFDKYIAWVVSTGIVPPEIGAKIAEDAKDVNMVWSDTLQTWAASELVASEVSEVADRESVEKMSKAAEKF